MTSPAATAQKRARAKAKKRAEQMNNLKTLAIGFAFGVMICLVWINSHYWLVLR